MPMSNIVTCAICSIRKEKRFCPAIHGRICPQCCGEQREVTLDCPSDCPYLLQAREHEKPQPAAELNAADLFLQVELSDQFMYEREHLILGLSFALAKSAQINRSLNDRDLIAALKSLAKSYETLVNSGLRGRSRCGRSHLRRVVSRSVQQQVRPRVRRKPVPPSGGDGAHTAADAVGALRERGLRVLAADGGASTTLDDLQSAGRLGQPTAWLFGNEAWGLPSDVLNLADDAVAVPIYGRAESLNLAAAAAVCLYASARARRSPAPAGA